MGISRREKDGKNYFLYGVFDHGWYEFELEFKYGKIQVPDPASGDLSWDQHGHIWNNPWKMSAKKFLIQFHVLPCN